jgi:gliding motility-associated-like protein
MDTASVLITVLRDYNVQISNVVTPNGDGYNDTWYIGNILNYPENEVTIFNRNGQVLYTKSQYANEWDATYNGNKLPDGTYFYVLKFTDSNISFKGDINIINSTISE